MSALVVVALAVLYVVGTLIIVRVFLRGGK